MAFPGLDRSPCTAVQHWLILPDRYYFMSTGLAAARLAG
jgi:hypothetical protein